MRVKFPLRYTVPAILFLIGLVLSACSFLYEIRLYNRALEHLVERHASFIGNQVSGLAAYFFAQEDLSGLKKQISQLGSDHALTTALVCDPEGKVLVATRFDYLERPLASTHLAYTGKWLTGLKGSSSRLSDDRKTLIGLFPFLLPPVGGELVSSRAGVVILEYDLTHPKQQAVNAAVDRSRAVIISLTVVCILAWICFHYFLNTRIQRLVRATKKLAAGEAAEITPSIRGSDEVAALARAFEETARQLSENTTELRSANEQLTRQMQERVLVQSALANSERRFRSTWENSRDAMRLSDRRGIVLAVNPAYCELVGLPAEDVLQRPFTAAYHQPDEEVLQTYLKEFAERKIPVRRQKVVRYKDGRTAHLDVAYSFIDVAGDEPLLLAIARDQSERIAALEEIQRSKEFTENLIRTANVLIIGLDTQGKIQIFNETAEKTLGWKKEEAVGLEFFKEFVRAGDQAEIETVFRSLKEGGCRTFENKVITRDGSERTISWQNNRILENNQVVGTLSFGIDVTEQRQEEVRRRLLESKMQETQKLESLGVLAGGIAHDFNNLLTAILGHAGLAALQLPADSPVRPVLGTIEKTSMRAADLCRQMLAYSGKGKLTAEQIDINDVIQETTQLLEISISKKAGLVFNLQPGLPAVECDPTQIRQVLMNLVINASEAMGDNQGVILVRTGIMAADKEYLSGTHLCPDLPGGEYVFFEVSDTGCGMSPETQARIFDPFFTTKFTGRGLGLAAVLGIVRGHKGALKLTSAPGRGSTFRVLLPALERTARPAGSPSGSTIPLEGKGTVLVVDDDKHVREITVRILQKYGFTVLEAGDGAEGVRTFEEHYASIDAVLLDMTMPRLNGSEAFQEIRRISPQARVLLMSGYTEPEQATSLQQEGWSGFVQKPFKPEDIARKLQAVISA